MRVASEKAVQLVEMNPVASGGNLPAKGALLAIAAVLNYLIMSRHMVLGFYTLPTLYSAYFYGRRHAILTAFASVFAVGLVVHYNPVLFSEIPKDLFLAWHWYDLAAWACVLLVTACAMGGFHEQHETRARELSQTYHGLLLILGQFVSKGEHTNDNSHRVSVYGAQIAAYMRLGHEQRAGIRAAARLDQTGKLEISRNLLHLEARVTAVADAYDLLTSDGSYGKAVSAAEAKQSIVKRSGSDFDPRVVKAFEAAFDRGDLEVPEGPARATLSADSYSPTPP